MPLPASWNLSGQFKAMGSIRQCHSRDPYVAFPGATFIIPQIHQTNVRMHYWTCVVQKAIPVFTAYYCSTSINIFELSNSPCGYYHLPMKLRECIVFSCVCLFAVGDGGSHMTSIHDALDPTVLPPPQIWKLIVHNPRQDGTPLYRYPHPRHGTSLCRSPKTLNIIVQFAPSRY